MSARGRIRLLSVIASAEIGGAERLAETVIRSLSPDEFAQEIVLRPGGALEREIRALGHPVHPLPLFDNFDLWSLARLVLLFRSGRFDVAHLHLNRAGLLGGLAGRFTGLPTVVTAAGMVAPRYVRHATVVAPCARAIAVHLSARGLRHPDVRVVMNGVCLEEFRARAALPVPEAVASLLRPDRRAITMVSRLHPMKGHTYLLDAAALVLPDFPDVDLLIVGGGDPRLVRSLSRRIDSDPRLAGRVHLTGPILEIAPVLARSALVVLPSLAEGLPTCLIEAMGLGVPVVSSNVGGVGELVSGLETGGLTVPPRDVAALALAIRFFLDHPDAAVRAGLRGRARADAAFSHRVMVGGYADVYRDLANRRRP